MMMPTYFISHGGGPWPYVPELRASMRLLEKSFTEMPQQLGQIPRAVLMISGHWQTSTVSVMSSSHPAMEYDYHGFPDYTYQIHYAAPGSPALADTVQALLQRAGLEARLDAQKGFDHGAFTPMAVMYPEADMPLVELSLQVSLDPAFHLAMGRALRPLRQDGILIVGSGLSYHNLRRFGPAAREPSLAFDDWLQDTLTASAPAARAERLVHWEEAPSARVAHPTEEHLMPLMVALGAAESGTARCVYHEEGIFGGVVASSFRFDD